MLENEKCVSCSKKDECQGKIVSLFNFIHNTIYQHYENKLGEFTLFIYRENLREIYYATFFYLMRNWTFSQGDKKKYVQWLRDKYPHESLSSGELSDNAIYKARRRYFADVASLHNSKISDYWNINEENFNLVEFILHYRKSRNVRKSKDENTDVDIVNQELIYSRIFEIDIFAKMYEYSMPCGHKYSLKKYKKDLDNIKCIYDDIEDLSSSYFDKCVKYEIVEYKLHYETAYKFSSALEKDYSFLSENDKYKALQYESVLRHVKNYGTDGKLCLTEFPVLANMDLWINMFFDIFINDYKRPIKCAEILFNLKNYINLVMDMCHAKMQDCFPEFRISECGFAENIFKNYIGEGQHITKDKDLTEQILKDMWTIFDKSDYIN